MNKRIKVSGVVAHTCNPSTGRQRQEDQKDSLGNIARPCLEKNQNRPGKMTHAYHPRYMGSINRITL
jgi:hypothetical protein